MKKNPIAKTLAKLDKTRIGFKNLLYCLSRKLGNSCQLQECENYDFLIMYRNSLANANLAYQILKLGDKSSAQETSCERTTEFLTVCL